MLQIKPKLTDITRNKMVGLNKEKIFSQKEKEHLVIDHTKNKTIIQ